MTCPRCGAVQPATPFCSRCGTPLGAAGDTDAAPTQLLRTTAPVPAPPWPPPAPVWVEPPPPPAPPTPRGSRRTVLVVAAVALAAVIVAAAVLLLRSRGTGSSTGTPPTTASVVSTDGSTGPSADGSTALSTGSTALSTDGSTADGPPASVPSTGESAAGTDPLGGPRSDIACGTGTFFVQLASSADRDGFVQVIADVRAAGLLPAGSRYARTSTSCAGLFSTDADYYVLWAGPFASVADACPTRLAGPDDAFVKSTDPGRRGRVFSCLCSAAADALPDIQDVGAHGPWVGELQRLLKSLDVPIDDLDGPGGPPSGTYSAGTAAAVRAFRSAHGLPASGAVDAALWSALRSVGC